MPVNASLGYVAKDFMVFTRSGPETVIRRITEDDRNVLKAVIPAPNSGRQPSTYSSCLTLSSIAEL